jgi:hypothetical protein
MGSLVLIVFTLLRGIYYIGQTITLIDDNATLTNAVGCSGSLVPT